MGFKTANEEKHTEVEIDDDFVGYVLNTYVSDKTLDEIGRHDIEAVISDLIENGAIDTDTLKQEDGYDEYMRGRHCNEISDAEDEEVDNRKAWDETYASLPR